MQLDAARSIEDADELRRTVPILIATILLFFVHKPLHLEPATVALSGATVMLLVTRQPLERALSGIEWPTLFFFVGLFVMVGALEHTGAIGQVADGIAELTGGDRTAELLGITWASALGSGLVDNIPFTAAMIPVVEQLQSGNAGDDAYWWALALGACFGGNATLIAAAANVAAAGMAARAGRPIGFLAFLRVGLPVTSRLADPCHRLHRHSVRLMNQRRIADPLIRDAPALGRDDRIELAVRAVLDSGLPALPVLDGDGRLCGVFGEREFFGALFPGYLQQLGYAGFVPRAHRRLARQTCRLPARTRRRVHDHRPRRRQRGLLRRPGRGDLPAPPRADRARPRRRPARRRDHPQRLLHRPRSPPPRLTVTPTPPIRVAIVDDHHAVRAGLNALLTTEPGILPVGDADRAEAVWPLLYRTAPDVILLDYQLPGTDGLSICHQIKSDAPAPAVVLYSAFADASLIIPAIVAGADGIVHKGSPAQQLFEAIRTAAQGASTMPPVPPHLLEAATTALEPGDLPILQMRLERARVRDIAVTLHHSPEDLHARIAGMLAALQARTVSAS